MLRDELPVQQELPIYQILTAKVQNYFPIDAVQPPLANSKTDGLMDTTETNGKTASMSKRRRLYDTTITISPN